MPPKKKKRPAKVGENNQPAAEKVQKAGRKANAVSAAANAKEKSATYKPAASPQKVTLPQAQNENAGFYQQQVKNSTLFLAALL